MPMHKLLVILFIAFILPSCTHLHVPADAKLANQLKEDFSKVTTNDSNIYSAMLENKEQMEVKEQLRLESLKKESIKSTANALYIQGWKEIRTELNNEKTRLVDVFVRMQRLGTYDVASDKKLMKVLEQQVAGIEGKFWKELSDEFLQRIRTHQK